VNGFGQASPVIAEMRADGIYPQKALGIGVIGCGAQPRIGRAK
jgi:hypothetical protein